MNRRVEPREANVTDAALMEGAAATLRKAWLDLEEAAKGGTTTYADEGFSTALVHLEEAIDALTKQATKAEENAVDDAAGELADRYYDDHKYD